MEKPNRLFSNPKTVLLVAERLSRCSQVTKYDSGEEKEAWTLAHSFSDLEEAFNNILTEHFPKLAQENFTDSELIDLLNEIGEELRHIIYHVKDPQYYRYLDSGERQK